MGVLQAAVAFLAVILALIALVRVFRLEREVLVLRRRLEALARTRPPASPETAHAPADLPSPSPFARPRQEAPLPSPPTTPVALLPRPTAAARAAEEDTRPDTLERRIGERLLLYAGMIVLVLGVAFFLRYAFEHEWLSPAVRVLLGAMLGAALVAGGETLARRGFRQYGLFLTGGGLAMLFLSVYSAFAIYGLIGQVPTFVLLLAVAALAAVLADRQGSLPLAAMAVSGGFATPLLVGGSGDAQITLFSYMAILIAATMYLAHRRDWPWLNLASFAWTVLLVAGWADAYYTPDRYLRTELFLTLYCAMFVAILRASRRSADPHARIVRAVLLGAPVVYHLASLAILFPHGVPLLVYLLLVTVAVVLVSLEAESPALRLAGWIAVVPPLVSWILANQEPGWIAAQVTASVGIWLIVLVAQVRLVRGGRVLPGADVALLHASALGAFGAPYAALVPFYPGGTLGVLAGVFAAVDVALWRWLRTDASPAAVPASLHWLGAAGALGAVAVAIGFEGQWTVAMWAAEAAALVWLGVRFERRAFRIAGLALFTIATWRWLNSLEPRRGDPFVALFNARALSGALVIALLYVAGWAMRGVRSAVDSAWRAERAGIFVGASVLTVILMTREIATFWRMRPDALDADLAQQLMLSASWAIYAAAVVIIGMRYHYPPVRYFAIALFGVTLLKVFAVDIQQLEGIYRVVAFIAVGVILLVVSFLYQRTRGDKDPL